MSRYQRNTRLFFIAWMTRILIFALLYACAQVPCATADEEKWREARSRHFIVYYQTVPEDFVKMVQEEAEDHFDRIIENLGCRTYGKWTFDNRVKLYIHSSQEEYIAASQQMNWSHGVAFTRQKVIRTFPTAHGFFDTTLPHELAHIIFRSFMGYQVDVPLWLEEGVAMYQERAKRWGANDKVRAAIAEKRFIPLEALTTMKFSADTAQAQVELFYAESASVVYFMISKYGDARFKQFLQYLKDGHSLDMAIAKAYIRFNSLEELNKAWVRYVNNK